MLVLSLLIYPMGWVGCMADATWATVSKGESSEAEQPRDQLQSKV